MCTCIRAHTGLPVLCQAFERAQSPIAVIEPPECSTYVFVVEKNRRQCRVCICYIFCYEKKCIYRALSTQQIVPEPNLAGTGWQICFLSFQNKCRERH